MTRIFVVLQLLARNPHKPAISSRDLSRSVFGFPASTAGSGMAARLAYWTLAPLTLRNVEVCTDGANPAAGVRLERSARRGAVMGTGGPVRNQSKKINIVWRSGRKCFIAEIASNFLNKSALP